MFLIMGSEHKTQRAKSMFQKQATKQASSYFY